MIPFKKSEQWLPLGARKQKSTGTGYFWGDGNILYHDWGWGYTSVGICDNSVNIHLRFLHFIVSKFYIKRKNFWIDLPTEEIPKSKTC